MSGIIISMKTLIFILSLIFSFYSFALDLTDQEKEILRQGEIVKRVNWREGYTWPQVTIISVLPHTPIENLAVFSDYESHKKFIPDMVKSKIEKQNHLPSPCFPDASSFWLTSRCKLWRYPTADVG